MTEAPIRPAPRGSSVLLYIVVVIGVSMMYRAVWPSFAALAASVDHGYILFADFVGHYAPTGRGLMETERASPGLHYSAFFALSMWWLMKLPWAAAVWVWSFLQLGGIVLLFALTRRRLCPTSAVVGAAYLLVLLTSFPVLHNFNWGQVSVFTTLSVFASLQLHERGKTTAAAAVLALGITVKYYPAVLIAYFAMRRDWRAVVLTGVFSLLLLIVIPAAFLGLDSTLRFYTLWEDLALARTAIQSDPNSQFFAHVMARVAGTGPWVRWIGYGIAAANLVLAYSMCRRRADDVAYGAAAALLLGIPFLIPTSWPHYFIYLPPLQLFLVRHAVRRCSGMRRWTVNVLVAASVALASVPLFWWIDDRVVYGSEGFVFWANTALLVALYTAFTARTDAGARA